VDQSGFNKLYCRYCGSDITQHLDGLGLFEGNCPVCNQPVTRQDVESRILGQYRQHWKEWRKLTAFDWLVILIVLFAILFAILGH
jgi:predicted amidophosphoribosyltransferase